MILHTDFSALTQRPAPAPRPTAAHAPARAEGNRYPLPPWLNASPQKIRAGIAGAPRLVQLSRLTTAVHLAQAAINLQAPNAKEALHAARTLWQQIDSELTKQT